jgi:isopentenyl-diphosphate delta-isomerase
VEEERGRDAAIKDAHIRVCLEEEVESPVPTGLETLALAGGLPDFSVTDLDATAPFLGRTLSIPLVIAPITGGGSRSLHINRNLAVAAERCGIAMAVGSQRPMLEKKVDRESYLVREWAPTVPLLANLGLVHARKGREYLLEAVESIGADGVILYVNPLHELLQAGGEGDFTKVTDTLDGLIEDFPYPIFIKEVGCGLPESVVRWASARKIAGVDVAGLGGTNWPRIEGLLQGRDYARYETLGTCTRDAIISARRWLREDQHLIGGGGIRTGIDMAKALALGATLTSMALPFLKWAQVSAERVVEGFAKLKEELMVALWFTGSRAVGNLRGKVTFFS